MTSPELTSLKEEVQNFYTDQSQGTLHVLQSLVDLMERLEAKVDALDR